MGTITIDFAKIKIFNAGTCISIRRKRSRGKNEIKRFVDIRALGDVDQAESAKTRFLIILQEIGLGPNDTARQKVLNWVLDEIACSKSTRKGEM
jgi:hypothetical protein